MRSLLNNSMGGLGARRRNAAKERPDNMIPMINIVFLLLLYFMVAGNLHVDMEVMPPRSASQKPPPQSVPKIVIKPNGAIVYRGRVISLAMFETDLAATLKDRHVQISADAMTDAVGVAKVIDELSKAGVKQVTLLSLKRQ